MRNLQILMEFAKDSNSEVIRRANGCNSLEVQKVDPITQEVIMSKWQANWANLKKVITNQIKNN
jgi:hypothetical protein